MSVEDIPEDVRAFILEHIHSVEQLDALLLLRRTRPRVWTAASLAEELRTSDLSAAARLRDLVSRGFVREEGGGFVYAAVAQGQDTIIGRLAAAYATYRYTTIELIFSKPIENIRNFARAFRLRKDDDDA